MKRLPEHLSRIPIGRVQLSREELSSYQRVRVVEAATEVFAKRGYQETTVDNIVSAAKIGVGSFYAHFDGKEDCFLAAYDRIVEEAQAEIAAALPAEGSWADEVVAVLRAVLGYVSSRRLRARIALVEVHAAGPRVMAHYEATLDSIEPHLRRGRAASRSAAELPANLEIAIIGGLLWLLQQRILAATFEPELLLADLVEIVAGPYLGETETKQLLARL